MQYCATLQSSPPSSFGIRWKMVTRPSLANASLLVRKLDRLIADGIGRRVEAFPGEDDEAHEFLDWFEPAFLKDLGHP